MLGKGFNQRHNIQMKKEIHLEYESWRKEMRGSSDQTAMNNKHIKRFHFSIRAHQDQSGAVQQRGADSFSSDRIIAFFKTGVTSIVAICSSVILGPSPSSYFPQRRFDGKMSVVGFFFLQILSFVISPSALFLPTWEAE